MLHVYILYICISSLFLDVFINRTILKVFGRRSTNTNWRVSYFNKYECLLWYESTFWTTFTFIFNRIWEASTNFVNIAGRVTSSVKMSVQYFIQGMCQKIIIFPEHLNYLLADIVLKICGQIVIKRTWTKTYC